MNDNAKQWVAALRSGVYTQGRRVLRSHDDEYCCLGVACDLALHAGVPLETEQTDDGIAYNGEVGYLPDAVVTWLGLYDNNGGFDVLDSGGRDNLAARNDEGATFAEIADLIESEPLELFVSDWDMIVRDLFRHGDFT